MHANPMQIDDVPSRNYLYHGYLDKLRIFDFSTLQPFTSLNRLGKDKGF